MAPGTRNKLAFPCSNLRSFWRKCTVLKKVLVILLGSFDASPVIRRLGQLRPLAPPHAPSSQRWVLELPASLCVLNEVKMAYSTVTSSFAKAKRCFWFFAMLAHLALFTASFAACWFRKMLFCKTGQACKSDNVSRVWTGQSLGTGAGLATGKAEARRAAQKALRAGRSKRREWRGAGGGVCGKWKGSNKPWVERIAKTWPCAEGTGCAQTFVILTKVTQSENKPSAYVRQVTWSLPGIFFRVQRRHVFCGRCAAWRHWSNNQSNHRILRDV